jgi:hypothetical protein
VATVVVLFLLAVLWAWYLVTWLRGRTEHRNVNSISSFSKHLSVLERATPVTSPRSSSFGALPVGTGRALGSRAMTLSEVHRRRRNVLTVLGGATAAAFLLTLVAGGAFVGLFVLSAGVLGGYVVLLARSRALQDERAQKVHYLHGWDDQSWDEEWDEEWDDEAWDEPAYAAHGS